MRPCSSLGPRGLRDSLTSIVERLVFADMGGPLRVGSGVERLLCVVLLSAKTCRSSKLPRTAIQSSDHAEAVVQSTQRASPPASSGTAKRAA
jgi:hypothetical protein